MSISPLEPARDAFNRQLNTWFTSESILGQLVRRWLEEELHRTLEEIESITLNNSLEAPLKFYQECTLVFTDGSTANREWTYSEIVEFKRWQNADSLPPKQS